MKLVANLVQHLLFASLGNALNSGNECWKRPTNPDKPKYKVNTVHEYVKMWKKREYTDSVNPCLYGTIASGSFDKNSYPCGDGAPCWIHNIGLRRYLKFRSETDEDKDYELFSKMAGLVGWAPYLHLSSDNSLGWEECKKPYANQGPQSLGIWDGCCTNDMDDGTQTFIPSSTGDVRFLLRRIELIGGFEIPQQVWNEYATNAWYIDSYTGCTDPICLASLDFGNKTSCECDEEFLVFLEEVGNIKNETDTKYPSRTVDKCLEHSLTKVNGGDITTPLLRAVLWKCLDANPINAFDGEGWIMTGSGTATGEKVAREDFKYDDANAWKEALVKGMTYPESMVTRYDKDGSMALDWGFLEANGDGKVVSIWDGEYPDEGFEETNDLCC